jgi:4-hydroxy-2-oxoheptanedioate aldolase
MMENRVKQAMRADRVALIGYVGSFPGPAMVELAAHAGFDGVRLDLEHGAFDVSDIQVKVIAAERHGITPIARVPDCNPSFILQLLDMGMQGITVPHVATVQDAIEIVNAVRYPTLGNRGLSGTSRAAQFGKLNVKKHVEQSNREILLGVLVEDADALDQIEEIAATPGVDLVAVGVNDLGQSLGVVGEVDHPKLVDAIGRISAAVAKCDDTYLSLSIGQKVFPRTLPELMALGVRYAHCGPAPEVRLLNSMTEQVNSLRKQMDE